MSDPNQVPPIPTPPEGSPAPTDESIVDDATIVRRPNPYAESTTPPGYVQPDPYATPAPAYAPTSQPGYQYAYQPAPAKGLAITSMVLGIVAILTSFCWFVGLVSGIVAVITGHLAIRRQPQARGFAIAGLITGYSGAAISLLVGIFAIVFTIWSSTGYGY